MTLRHCYLLLFDTVQLQKSIDTSTSPYQLSRMISSRGTQNGAGLIAFYVDEEQKEGRSEKRSQWI